MKARTEKSSSRAITMKASITTTATTTMGTMAPAISPIATPAISRGITRIHTIATAAITTRSTTIPFTRVFRSASALGMATAAITTRSITIPSLDTGLAHSIRPSGTARTMVIAMPGITAAMAVRTTTVGIRAITVAAL